MQYEVPENEARFASYPSLRDRVVLVTGGATGIGAAIVEAFARQGARVAFLDLLDESAEALVAQIAAAGHTAPAYLHCDLTDVDLLQDAIGQLMERLGPIDVLVNNAANDTRHSIEGVTSDSWDQSMGVNMKAQFFAAQAVIPPMKQAQRGSIINMSSISWIIPATGLPMYVMAKAAIVGMTRTLAHELGADNIRVNCVLPGAILTERQKRLWFTPEYEANHPGEPGTQANASP